MLEQLQALQAEDPDSVLIARRLHRLGFGSPQKLEEHFSHFGPVKLILVPHSRVKASPGRRARSRPASIGFVVMGTAEAAAAALLTGDTQEIGGYPIIIQAFEKRDRSEEDEECLTPVDCFNLDGTISTSTTPGDTTRTSTTISFYNDERFKDEKDQDPEGASTPDSQKVRWADLSEEPAHEGRAEGLQLPTATFAANGIGVVGVGGQQKKEKRYVRNASLDVQFNQLESKLEGNMEIYSDAASESPRETEEAHFQKLLNALASGNVALSEGKSDEYAPNSEESGVDPFITPDSGFPGKSRIRRGKRRQSQGKVSP